MLLAFSPAPAAFPVAAVVADPLLPPTDVVAAPLADVFDAPPAAVIVDSDLFVS